MVGDIPASFSARNSRGMQHSIRVHGPVHAQLSDIMFILPSLHISTAASVLRRLFFMQKRSCSSPCRRPVLTLFTKEDCSLCDEAMEILRPYMDQVNYEEVDITLPENKDWYRRYRYDIPVFHLDGSFLMKHRADPQLLVQRITEITRLHNS